MAKIEVLLGDFTFLEPTLFYPKTFIKQGIDIIYDNHSYTEGRYCTIINKVENVCYVEEAELDSFCENSLEKYESYLIPSRYNGEIIGSTLIPKNYNERH